MHLKNSRAEKPRDLSALRSGDAQQPGEFDSDQGRMEEARKEFEEALQISRELAQKNQEIYRRYLADMLNKLGDFDWTKDRTEEARKEYGEVLQTYRELAQKNPETYRPYVADTLNNLGNLDSDQGRMEEARKEYAEALQIYQALAKARFTAVLGRCQ